MFAHWSAFFISFGDHISALRGILYVVYRKTEKTVETFFLKIVSVVTFAAC